MTTFKICETYISEKQEYTKRLFGGDTNWDKKDSINNDEVDKKVGLIKLT